MRKDQCIGESPRPVGPHSRIEIDMRKEGKRVGLKNTIKLNLKLSFRDGIILCSVE